jgi:hypothetical protein
MNKLAALALPVLTLSAGIATAAPTSVASSASASTAKSAPPLPSQMYRLEVSIVGIDPDANAAPATYVFVLPEHVQGELSTDDNVPLGGSGSGPGAQMRQDVGVELEMSAAEDGKVLVVKGDIEISSIDPASNVNNRIIHRVRARSSSPMTLGTPSLFASLVDITTHRRYEVTVLAKKWQ